MTDDAYLRTPGGSPPKHRAGPTREPQPRHVRRAALPASSCGKGPPRDEWTDWLDGQKWDHFATFTFRHENPTVKQLRRSAARLQAAAQFERFFWICEKGEVGGRHHLHGLMAASGISNAAVWDWWFTRYGRALVEDYDPDRGAASYVSKYMLKRTVDYDMLLCPPRLRMK